MPSASHTTEQHELSILVPCLNEEKAVQICLDQIKSVIRAEEIRAEVIFINNGSTDGTRLIIEKNLSTFPELRLVNEPRIGYGSAYLRGFAESSGRHIFMADCDGTYDFRDIPKFIRKLREGSDLVLGNRFSGPLQKGVMPSLHRYVGNPLLSFLVKKFFNVKINDIHCGARAVSREELKRITLYTRGMEFASEMVIKCAKRKAKIEEIPILYGRRIGTSKLNSFRDGWRHLRFILLYSPLFLFLVPGAVLFTLGFAALAWLYFFDIQIGNTQLYVHPMFLSSIVLILGYQLIMFAGFARTYAITHLGDTDAFLEPLYSKITIEKAGVAGIAFSLIGASFYIYILSGWFSTGINSLLAVKNSILALCLLTVGIQTFFSAFIFSILGIKEK